jgi:UDP-N-acetylglucosamine 2-epimerase (non-hydrolysing)
MIVFGTRPEAIKMAPLCHLFAAQNDFKTIVCVTAQHREMLDQVLEIFEVSPDIDLNVMQMGQDLFDVTSNIMLKMRDSLKNVSPDLVLVHGDTSTTFATALACFYLGIKVGHVEAGLRTNNILAPFPEEYNRQSTGIIADIHFAPTEKSKKNLLMEGKDSQSVFVTGNTVIDSLYLILNKIDGDKETLDKISTHLNKCLGFDWKASRFVLITGHRRENFGEGFLNICEAIKELATNHPDINFVYPVHLNPNVQKPVKNILYGLDNVWLIDPLEYQSFVVLLQKCHIVLTDSGGIQEEAPSLGKPVLVMRDSTERPEAVLAGTVKLVGSSKENIIKSINLLIDDEELYEEMSQAHNPFGDGKACQRIVSHVRDILND